MFTVASFAGTGLSLTLTQHLVEAANYSKSRGTWSSYGTVKKHLVNCQKELEIKFSFPMSSNQVLVFLAWLIRRNLKASTMNSYISALRTIHLSKGLDSQALRPPIVAAILEGRAHIDTMRMRLENKAPRLPVTPSVLRLLKACLNNWDKDDQTILLVWCVSLICFFGGFRIHEVLCKTEQSFDPCFTLLSKDIKLNKIRVQGGIVEVLQVRIKSPKEDRIGKDHIIDVYQTKSDLCPVDAFKNWQKSMPPHQLGKPAFRLPSGKPLTGRQFNNILKSLLEPHLDYSKGKISSHSF